MTAQATEKIDEFVKAVMSADEESARVPFWAPQEGDVIVGRITNISAEDGIFGVHDVYTVYNELLDSYVRVSANSVLSARLRDFGATVGDRIGIKYLGTRKGKKGKEYRLYAVFVDEKDRSRQQEAAPENQSNQDGQDEEIPF